MRIIPICSVHEQIYRNIGKTIKMQKQMKKQYDNLDPSQFGKQNDAEYNFNILYRTHSNYSQHVMLFHSNISLLHF